MPTLSKANVLGSLRPGSIRAMSARIRLLWSLCPVCLALTTAAATGCGDDDPPADPSAGTTEEGEATSTTGETTGTSEGSSGESSSSGVATTSLPEGECVPTDVPGPCLVAGEMALPSRDIAFGDFDDDGDIDVLAQNTATDTPEIWLLQNDAGTFDGGAPLPFDPDFQSDGEPGSLGVLVSMKTAEGDRAIVQGTYGSLGAVQVDVWRSTASSFSRLYAPTGSPPTGPWVGDFDGNGSDDLAFAPMANSLETLELRACDGQGCQDPATVSAMGGPAGPWTILGADVTADGLDDLLVYTTDTGVASVTVLEATGGDFTVGTTSSLGSGLSPFFVRAHDFDGDGRAELIVVSDGGDGSSNEDGRSLTRFTADGDGAFTSDTTMDAPARITGLGFGNVLGDAASEVVIRVTDAPGVMVVDGSTLDATVVYELQTDATGQSGAAIGVWPTLVADIDGTGSTDIATVVRSGGGFALATLRALPES